MDHSEIKHLPKVDHTPAELNEASKLLLAAADVIERDGWCQCFIGSLGGMVCIEGALMVAYGKEPATIIEYYPIPHAALRRIRDDVGKAAHLWNDERGRTKDEVIAKLRSVALAG